MTRLSLETHHDTGWARAVGELIQAGQRLGARGWLPATSGNLSCRLDRETIAITASGIDKTALTERHILRVPMAHEPPPNASAETPLHLSA